MGFDRQPRPLLVVELQLHRQQSTANMHAFQGAHVAPLQLQGDPMMTGVFVWLKNNQDPPIFWPAGSLMTAVEVRENQQRREAMEGWIFLGNYEIVRP